MAELKELGTLIVVVGKARNLPNKSRFGKQDPFCTVAINEEKQKTKPIKRGGQHPEWDEELRFTIHEDVDDLLVRSESQNQFDSLSSKHTSLSSNMNPSQPTPPPKDSANASLNSSLSGSVTAQSLANKSRKGPINKKGGKSMKVACYADDAKEPELIGECTVPIDEVLKQGEVDEWYEFTFKDKYSGEVYLELTFYSNDAPPVKRNVPRPSVHPYDVAGSSSSSLSGRPGGLVASGSVSGMNLYIPPYVQAGRVSPGPTRASGSFADLGLPPGHRQSLTTPSPANPIDAITRPMSNMSIANPPPAQQTPPHQAHGYGHHRHSLGGGPADAPWAQSLPQHQPSHAAAAHRPLSAAESMSYISQVSVRDPRRTPQPQPFPSHEHRSSVPLPIPSSLVPGQGPSGYGEPRPHAQSFSGPSRPVVPPQSSYLQPSPGPTPPPHPSSAPPNPQPPPQPHYQMPTSSFAGIAQPGMENRPYPQDYGQNQGGPPEPSSRSNSLPVRQPSPQPPMQQQGQPYYPDRSHTPRPSYSGSAPAPPTQQTPPHNMYEPRGQPQYGQPPSQPYQPPAPELPREPTPNSQGYVPWYQQTQPSQPTPAPPPAQSTYGHQQYAQAPAPPPPLPTGRPQSVAPTPPGRVPPRPSVGYYPSDELYVQQQDQRTQPEPPRAHTPQPAPAPWQQQQPNQGQYGYQPPPLPHENRYTPSPAPSTSSAQSSTAPYPGQQPQQQPVYQLQRPEYGYQSQAQQQPSYATSTSPAPYVPQHTPSPYQPANIGTSPPRAPEGWQSTVPAQRPPPPAPYRAPSPMQPQPNGWSGNTLAQPPVQAPRASSPLPSQIGQDWRSYMKSLTTPANPQPEPGRSPSPASLPPIQDNRYHPPPSLPTSLRTPDGWNSATPTASDGYQWKR